MSWIKASSGGANSGNSSTSQWTGKNWYFFGDSISDSKASPTVNMYHKIIKSQIGVNTYDLALNGTGYLARYNGSSQIIAEKVWDMSTATPKPDLVTFFAGTNDYGLAGAVTTLGTISDAPSKTTTFYAAVKLAITECIKAIGATSANCKFAIFTPLPRSSMNDVNGIPFASFINAIREIADYYGVPILDLHNAGLRPWDANWKTAYMPDGLHPNDAGHALIAPKILKFLNEL
jgi:lysophospholipase L1-like esterase